MKTIDKKYPELSKYIEKLTAGIMDEKSLLQTAENQQTYYDSMNSLMSKYVLERPGKVIKEKNWTSLVYANL
jgi:hypothetical protein